MAYTVLVIAVDGHLRSETVACLDDLQKLVGGYIESLPLTEDSGCYVNEDGIQLQLPRNELATQVCTEFEIGLAPDDYIKGPMVVFGVDDSVEGYCDVPPEVEQRIRLMSAGAVHDGDD